MAIPYFQKGTKVLIIDTNGRSDIYKNRQATIIRVYGDGGWILDVDNGTYWWPSGSLQILCCAAKGCMWHKKDSK